MAPPNNFPPLAPPTYGQGGGNPSLSQQALGGPFSPPNADATSVALGLQALNALTTSPANSVAVGYLALQSVVAGIQNTALGSNAGRTATGNRNIFLGYFAGAYELGDDRLIIDSRDRVNTAGQLANALLYGVMAALPANQYLILNGQLSLGSSTPNALGNGGTQRTAQVIQAGGQAYFSLGSDLTADTSLLGVLNFGTTGASTSKTAGAIQVTLDGSGVTHASGKMRFYVRNGATFAEVLDLNKDLSVKFFGAITGVTALTMTDKLIVGGAGLGAGYAGDIQNQDGTGSGLYVRGGGGATARHMLHVDRYDGLPYFVVDGSGVLTMAAYGSGGGTVSAGAADSGGAGYKLLRVPN